MSTTPMMFRILNPIMKTILKSPLHKVVSEQIMIITFLGAKSGKEYSTPVSYSREGDKVTCFTHAIWWKNFNTRADVKLRIQGQDLIGHAEAITDDPDRTTAGLARHILAVPFDAKYYGITFDSDGQPDMDQVKQGAAEAVMIQISLDTPLVNQDRIQ